MCFHCHATYGNCCDIHDFGMDSILSVQLLCKSVLLLLLLFHRYFITTSSFTYNILCISHNHRLCICNEKNNIELDTRKGRIGERIDGIHSWPDNLSKYRPKRFIPYSSYRPYIFGVIIHADSPTQYPQGV